MTDLPAGLRADKCDCVRCNANRPHVVPVTVRFRGDLIEPARDDYWGTAVVSIDRTTLTAVVPANFVREREGSIDELLAEEVPSAVELLELWRRDRAARLGQDDDELVRATGVLIAAAVAWIEGR